MYYKPATLNVKNDKSPSQASLFLIKVINHKQLKNYI